MFDIVTGPAKGFLAVKGETKVLFALRTVVFKLVLFDVRELRHRSGQKPGKFLQFAIASPLLF